MGSVQMLIFNPFLCDYQPISHFDFVFDVASVQMLCWMICFLWQSLVLCFTGELFCLSNQDNYFLDEKIYSSHLYILGSYCECFAAGVYCVEPCSCQGCLNKPVHEETVLATRKQIESRNPLAFAPKVIRTSEHDQEMGVGTKNYNIYFFLLIYSFFVC